MEQKQVEKRQTNLRLNIRIFFLNMMNECKKDDLIGSRNFDIVLLGIIIQFCKPCTKQIVEKLFHSKIESIGN